MIQPELFAPDECRRVAALPHDQREWTREPVDTSGLAAFAILVRAHLRAARNSEKPGRYEHEEAQFFQTQSKGFVGIDRVVAWARTDRGGRQMPLIAPPARGGCMRWGICDLPSGGKS